VGLVLEVTYESAAGLRHEYDSQLKLGGLFVPVAAPAAEAFAPVLLLLVVDGAEPVRVQTRLTVAGADSLCVEVLPEAAAPLAEAVMQLCQNCDATASKDRRSVRLLDGEPPPAPAPAPAERAEALTLDRKIAALSVGEKVRMALHGTRDERTFLARERAGVVQSALVRNPNTSIDEILALARSAHLAPEAAETMLAHRSFGASAQVLFALVRNPRTPISVAVETVAKLQPSDLRTVAKGTGVRAQVAQAARKKLLG
jgi:hypothetical protein